MKICYIDDRCYKVFVNNLFSNIDVENKEELEKLIRKVVKWLNSKNSITISGLFEVNIYVNEKIGMFIEFEKISSLILRKDIDLKISIIYNCDFYFKTDYYEYLENIKNVFYGENYYYTNVCNIDKILDYIELGDIVYDNDINLERDFIRIK